MTFNNTTISNELYASSSATTSSNPFVVVFQTRAPTVNDIQYPIQKVWLNTTLNDFWFLKNFNTSSGITTATWIPMSTSTAVETLTGNTGGAVPPDGANTIFVVGDGTYITTAGNPGTNTLTIQGIAGGIVSKFTVDAHTAPGTNPVVPDASGNVTITGGQVAAGTTTNVIRTDSLAANTYTIEIQRSQAVASSTVGDNGVSHFNSAQFTVDANGFVSSLGSAFNYTNVTHTMSPYTVLTTDYYISCDSSTGTITLDFPNAPAFKRLWIVKDRTGNCFTNNITLTTPGGVVTFDGQTSLIMDSNYMALNILANSTPTYEVF
jgi:hypothetical protein